MKRFLLFLSIFCIGFSLVACGNDEMERTEPTEPVGPTVPTVPTPTVPHEHKAQGEWKYDENGHWHLCECSEKVGVEAHAFNGGEVSKEPTIEEEGIMVYTCKCGYSYEEAIEKLDERAIEVDYVNGVLYMPTERDLRVAQFADSHFGVDNRDWHNDKIERTKEYMTYIVETTDPDFIVCSGDNVIGTGITNSALDTHDLEEFVEFIESFKTPWTFMYGNHDAENHVKREYSEYFLECIATGKTKYLVYKEDYIEEENKNFSSSDEGRYGNFVLPVYDIDDKDNLLGAYIFLDSGTYLYDKSKYQNITVGQVSWYESKVKELNTLYEGDGVVPTIVFSHIQLPEHAIAYNKAYYSQTEGYEFVIRQDEMAKDFESVSSQDPAIDSGLFDTMVRLKSTKAYFVGHAHEYYFQVKSHGIILGYGPQCGFSKLFELNDMPRLSYVYNFNSNFDFTTTGVEEVEDLGEGLVLKYFDGTNGDYLLFAEYDEKTGLYSVEVDFLKQWARVKLYYNNQMISTTDSSYTFTGDYQETCDTTSLKLYPGSDPANLFYPNSRQSKIVITFDPETKTVEVKAPEPEKVEAKGLYIEYTVGTPVETRTANIETADADGNYIFQVDLAVWRSAKLYFDGELLMDNNTTITGLYTGTDAADWTMNLYWASNNDLMTSEGGTYIFVYNKETKTLKIGSTGLLYNVNKAADYDKATNTYSFTLKPGAGDKLVLDLNAVALTGRNATITGDFSTATSDVTGNVYYQKADDVTGFYCAGAGTYNISYNATTKTLNFEYVVQRGLSYTTRYNGTTNATPVDYQATENEDGTYTITFDYSKAWGYIYLTYNGVQLNKDVATYPTSYPAGVYYENGGIYCNSNAAALGTYELTFDPATNTITLVKVS